jgi:hypothetical protein
MAKPKTWAQLTEEVEETFRKWRKERFRIENDLPSRSRTKRYQLPEEREVRVRFWHSVAGRGGTEIKLDVRREQTATENLQLLAVALEMIRLAEVREVTDLVVLLYRQMYPAPAPKVAPSPPPPGGSRQIPPHYAVLHIDPSAPLEVAEAAYRALARKAHPDAGGDAERMKRLNAAIERIREEKR